MHDRCEWIELTIQQHTCDVVDQADVVYSQPVCCVGSKRGATAGGLLNAATTHAA